MNTSTTKPTTPLGRTVIDQCGCLSDYQDALYGKGNRAKNTGAKALRCTVCGRESLRPNETKTPKP